MTMPLPRTDTKVLAVPRSMARSPPYWPNNISIKENMLLPKRLARTGVLRESLEQVAGAMGARHASWRKAHY